MQDKAMKILMILLANGFNPVEINMQPLHCVDSEYKAMYLALKEVHMNYEE